jgi:hypothetical protein
MGLYGMVVVTTVPPSAVLPFTAYPGVTYNSDLRLLLSEIDPVQNIAVNVAVNTPGFSETAVWSGKLGACGDPAVHTCYPPAVNYDPRYHLVNGISFDKTGANAVNSYFPAAPAGRSGALLVRFVNAGLRMHVPSVVGAQTGTSPTPGFSLIAEDGNVLPGIPRVQNQVFLAAGKTYDVMINAPSASVALPIFDRQLSLSTNDQRDGGMQGYIGVAGTPLASPLTISGTTGTLSSSGLGLNAQANADTYNSVIAGQTLSVSDPARGVIANDVNIYGVKVSGAAPAGLTLYTNGTFTYTAGVPTSFTYCGNGATSGPACALVTLGLAQLELRSAIHMNPITYTSNVATTLSIKPPGILSVDTDDAGYPLTVAPGSVNPAGPPGSWTLSVDPNGGFNATVPAPGTYRFLYRAQNSQGVISAAVAQVTLIFPTPSNLAVTVKDAKDGTRIADFRWVIEEDRTFFVNPNCTTTPLPAGCPAVNNQHTPAVFGTSFHTSHMPLIATGCTGPLSCESGQTIIDTNPGSPTYLQHVSAVCDIGNGVCEPGSQLTTLDPGQVHLDPRKRYYISVLPGDAANPFGAGFGGEPVCPDPLNNGTCGHTMGGAPIACTLAAGEKICSATDPFPAVTVLVEPTPLKTAKLTVFVFEDDFPLNGEYDAGGGIDALSPNEIGLGGFEITIYDAAGGTGDSTGQPTYDMFNMPLSNSLVGTIDPVTGIDACPISPQVSANVTKGDGSQKGIVGMIVTCPFYESDGVTKSPLAGQAVIANMYPGRYGVEATPGADRIARGEEWLQTNTLDGQHAHDSFLRVGEPSYFQEFGPAGFHVAIGFANPKIINARKVDVCPTPADCPYSVTGQVTAARLSRTPDQRLYSSGSRDILAFTQCYVSLGDPDGEDFAFTKCAADGTFTLAGIPSGDWKVTIFDQWNDQIVDGIMTPIRVTNSSVDMGQVAVHQWHTDLYTSTFIDKNGNGVRDDGEPGLPLVYTNVRFRDGSFSNFNNTDLEGNAGYNEVFPLFNWYVVETDSTRYKNTGTHVVYDAGGPTDGSPACKGGTAPCGSSNIGNLMANTAEVVSLPTSLRVPGAVYCANADCTGKSIANGPASSDPPSVCTTSDTGVTTCSTTLSTGRIDPSWVTSYGWQGFIAQNSFLEFGKAPFAEAPKNPNGSPKLDPGGKPIPAENGGIHGHVVYASTRPFDDPQLLLQLSWEPLIPNVTMNLYQESTDTATGAQTLKLVDTTQTSSWDDWAQGFYPGTNKPYMSCPGQGRDTGNLADLFFYSLRGQPDYLDWYNARFNGGTLHTIPFDSQFKCYDGMHNWNQLQPAPYDGMYQFPSVIGRDPTSGALVATKGSTYGTTASMNGTNCTICVTNPVDGTPMLPAGKYVVEVVVPPGFELVKEEDKNILIGDNYIAPVTQQFGGLASIFIMPDQAAVGSSYNPYNPQNPTTNLGAQPRHEGDTGSIETFWQCVGQARVVPDYISLFPGSQEVAPFAGATRNLCDRKEVTLEDQMSVLAKFYLFTPTHLAAHFTGIILDDFTSEFDPFSPQFGEKFAPAYLPVSVRDFNGNEITRTHADMFGLYNGLNYSTWEVNPPNPTGYAPTMMVVCMNDAGNETTPDPLFQQAYSQFCYELPFMPGQTGYFDTPVVPTSAFAEGYNHPECSYPDATPAIKSVTSSDIAGPWVSAAGHTLSITALGDVQVDPYSYSGPSVTTPPFNAQKVTRHYGFGATQGTGSVTIGGIPATVTGWSNTQITVIVPPGVPTCPIQQQAQYGGPNGTTVSTARCGELVITAGNGKTSIDTVTVTIGGKPPTLLTAPAPGTIPEPGVIQSAIDAASPGDLIIVPPGIYTEMVLMWKPVRLQGVGAVSAIINASAHPSSLLLNPWRERVVCLFGLGLDGVPATWDPICAAGWNAFTATASPVNPQVDRLPLEATVGWDASLNGNLAEQLLEPTLMGAYEGSAITVLAKGVDFHGANPWNAVTEVGAFPDVTTLLTVNDCGTSNGHNPNSSNFWCNPSSIDALGITNSSQGGGGIYVHGWAHNIQIANNRVYDNTGTLSGGITIGQGEHPPGYLAGAGAVNSPPGSCMSDVGIPANVQLPYCFDMNVNVHHNAIVGNSSLGDELFSSTPAGAGGITFCSGSDYYKFNYNWICGNMSSGDGAGMAQLGFVYQDPADSTQGIRHNTVLFNQTTNPTIVTNGGGILVYSAPDTDIICSTIPDKDCPTGLGDGSGPGLVIDSNLILGNAAESGSGGGLRLQFVNGTEVSSFPDHSERWYSILVQNNIIANNVAGLDGAGVSLQDALVVNFVNNTVISNDSTASAGILFNTLFAPLASSLGKSCVQANGTQSCPQVAGLVSVPNSPGLIASLPAEGITCPAGHSNCAAISNPILDNDVFWQNRSFFISVGPLGQGMQNQQSVVSLFDAFTQLRAPTQPTTDATAANGSGSIITGGAGACVTPVSYWDLGVRGDTGPAGGNQLGSGGSDFRLAPTYSVITDASDYPSANNSGGNPTVVRQYCNGSRTPPEICTSAANCLAAYGVNPGTNENNAPNPVFSLSPSATVDEGNNWINLRFGPLSLTHPVNGSTLGNFAPAASSSVINLIPSTAGAAYALAPTFDFFGNSRKTNNAVDAGAIEFTGGPGATVTGGPLAFGTVAVRTTSATQNLTLSYTGTASLTGIVVVVTSPFTRVTTGGFPAGVPNCGTTLAAGANCTIKIAFAPTAAGPATGTVTITASVAVTGSPVALSGTGAVPLGSATFLPTSWSPSAPRGIGIIGPTQAFTLTNTSNGLLTGITQGVLGGASPADYTIIRNLSTCGPAGGGQLLGLTSLNPGASCVVTVQFSPLVTDQAGSVRNATVSVTDAAGTQTSTLSGTAN